MNTTYTKADRLRIGLRWAWIGPAAGIVAMAALFVYGIVIGSAPLLTVASSTAGGLGAVWTSIHVALKAQLAKETLR